MRLFRPFAALAVVLLALHATPAPAAWLEAPPVRAAAAAFPAVWPDHGPRLEEARDLTSWYRWAADQDRWFSTALWNGELERQAEQAAAEARAARQRARAHTTSSSSSGHSAPGGFFGCIRGHESDTSGGYAAINPNGHFGAYQFSQQTWDATARRHGRYDLIGVRPDRAAADDQDQMARWLLADAGPGQWSTSGSCL